MPLYTISTKKELKPEAKLEIVNAITNTHCKLTGAPSSFVHVAFAKGVSIDKSKDLHIFGSVRNGRGEELNKKLAQTLRVEVSRGIHTSAHKIEVLFLEVPASWIMESGMIMPEPGDEAGWLRVQEKLAHSAH